MLIRHLIDHALARFAEQLRERFRAATVEAATRGVEAGLAELNLDVAVADALPAVRGVLGGPAPERAPTAASLPVDGMFPESAKASGAASPKRGRGRPRKYLRHETD